MTEWRAGDGAQHRYLKDGAQVSMREAAEDGSQVERKNFVPRRDLLRNAKSCIWTL